MCYLFLRDFSDGSFKPPSITGLTEHPDLPCWVDGSGIPAGWEVTCAVTGAICRVEGCLVCLQPRECAGTGCCLGDAPDLLGKLVPAMEKAAVTHTLISDALMRTKGFLFVNNSHFPRLPPQKGGITWPPEQVSRGTCWL